MVQKLAKRKSLLFISNCLIKHPIIATSQREKSDLILTAILTRVLTHGFSRSFAFTSFVVELCTMAALLNLLASRNTLA